MKYFPHMFYVVYKFSVKNDASNIYSLVCTFVNTFESHILQRQTEFCSVIFMNLFFHSFNIIYLFIYLMTTDYYWLGNIPKPPLASSILNKLKQIADVITYKNIIICYKILSYTQYFYIIYMQKIYNKTLFSVYYKYV